MSTATVAFIRTLTDEQLEMYLSMLGATPATPAAAYIPTPENPTAVNEADVYVPIFVEAAPLIGMPEPKAAPKATKAKTAKQLESEMRQRVFQVASSLGLPKDEQKFAYRTALRQLGFDTICDAPDGRTKAGRKAKADAARIFAIIDG